MKSKFFNYLLVLCISMLGINAPVSANLNSQNKLSFIENKGQITDQNWHPRNDIDFKLASNKGLSIFIGHSKILYQFSKEALTNNPMDKQSNTAIDWSRMEVELIGANPDAIIIKEQPSPYYEQYNTLGFRNLKASAFSKIVYKDIYPKIDWVLYVEGDYLKHEFHVHPGGQYSDIQLKYNGTESLQLDPNGNLIASCSLGQIVESAPVSFHQNGQLVASKFLLDHQQLRYNVGEFKGDLIIDPSLSWSTYYGGSSYDNVGSVVGTGNSVFFGGSSLSSSNIATVGAYKFTNAGGGADAFVVKMTTDGVRQWATYFGGFGGENGTSIAMDNNGSVYISGNTNSISGISTAGAHQTASASSGLESDAYLAKFSNEGSLIWATYYGGEENEGEAFVATDISGNVFLSGTTNSATGIATAGSHQPSLASPDFNDAFLAKFNSSGVRQWGTYYGGLSLERAYKVTTDKMGNVYITGQTNSPSAIATMGTHQSAYAGSVGSTSTDGYVAKFNTGGVRQWSTYYGGSGSDIAYAAAIDDSLNVYLVGSTFSTDKIASTAAYQTSWGGGVFDAFITKLDKNGIRVWGTYYGFIGEDVAYDVAVRGIKDVFISGYTSSNFNIASDSAFQKTLAGGYDAMLLHFNDSGKRVWSSYYGGDSSDFGRQMSVSEESLYMCGITRSKIGIATSAAHQTIYNGYDEGYLLKFIFTLPKVPAKISELSPNEFKVLPNPFQQLIQIESMSNLETIEIHNALGQRVFFQEGISTKKTSVDLQNLSSGTYFLSVNHCFVQQINKL
jgi:hypothetical protein